MNTNRVKNILISLLTITALALGGLILAEGGRYTLSAAQENAVIDLLARNNIELHADILRDFRPMRALALERYDHNEDIENFVSRFFGDHDPNPAIEGNSLFFYTEDWGLVMAYLHEENILFFEIADGFTNDAFAASPGGGTAEQLAIEFITHIFGAPDDLELHSIVFGSDGEYIITFFSSYHGNILYNNRIRVRVDTVGITNVLYSRVANHSHTGDARAIFSADEALMALMNHLRQTQVTGRDGRILLTQMYMAYFLQDNRGVPSYVFTIYLGNNLRFNYIFNAFTNEFLTYEIIR